MASFFKDDNRKWQRFMSQLPKVEALEVVIGVQADATDDDKELIVTRAVANELGTAKIPARPFISTASDENRQSWWARFDKALDQALVGNMAETFPFEAAGQVATRDIKRKIDAIKTPPNSPRTIAMKGSSNPLVDTGQLRNAITHLVRRAGTIV